MVAEQNMFDRFMEEELRRRRMWERAMSPDSPGGCEVIHSEAMATLIAEMDEEDGESAVEFATYQIDRLLAHETKPEYAKYKAQVIALIGLARASIAAMEAGHVYEGPTGEVFVCPLGAYQDWQDAREGWEGVTG